MNLSRRNKEDTTEESNIKAREQYAEDFKAFMEKSHLQFYQQDVGKVGPIIYVGYKIRTPPAGIWLYALVGYDMIAAGLRVLSQENMDILKNKKEDIQNYFNEALDWRENGIGINRYNIDLMDNSNRFEEFYFLRHTLETLDLVFRDRVGKLD